MHQLWQAVILMPFILHFWKPPIFIYTFWPLPGVKFKRFGDYLGLWPPTQDFNLVEALVDQIDLLDSRKTRMNVNSFQEDRRNVIPEQDNPR